MLCNRHEVECNLTFLGFIVFENKLKPRTIPSLKTLHNAGIRQIMCTGMDDIATFPYITISHIPVLGDNVLTAVSVSRECGLVDYGAEIYVPRFLSGSSTDPQSKLTWESVLNEGYTLYSDTLEVSLCIQLESYAMILIFLMSLIATST